ncbi:putative striated muscle-specific serine/threonine-protein kinase-like [Apostichopus japonicus]|uniref:Putative striated muscle-specific serine/threonine-protein kinase-like n=1 Tax=Stichopus japonicus TaxID=307972 RepID=A0A2G8JXE7_STIJA|nr:putative striated muscle-specific serine/threonine-protein kinase-like [Apostichopus japonicus]
MKEKSPGGGEPAQAKFSKRLQDTSTREGTMIQLKCQVTGNPEPEVTWLFETKHVVPCQDKRITMKAGLATLTILSVQLEDAGIYACEISNGVGNKLSCTCKVVVMEDRTKKFGGKTPNFDKVISDAPDDTR